MICLIVKGVSLGINVRHVLFKAAYAFPQLFEKALYKYARVFKMLHGSTGKLTRFLHYLLEKHS